MERKLTSVMESQFKLEEKNKKESTNDCLERTMEKWDFSVFRKTNIFDYSN